MKTSFLKNPLQSHHHLYKMKNQYQIEDKIIFIKRHLESLDHFLPETYEYLMEELDYQEKELMKIKIKLFDSEQSK